MKFLYEYQDRSNKRHRGVLNAQTRADAYAALKVQGIKPIRCEEAPGFFNLLFGKGKRWLAIGVLAIACVTLAAIIRSTPAPSALLDSSLDSPIRRQLIGDAAVIEKGVRTGWAEVFAAEGDRFLASFAIPGTEPAVRNVTEEKLKEALAADDAASRRVHETIEARQIRAIVSGMKKDIAGLLASGWTLRDVGAALVQRQEQEIAYYDRAKTEIETAAKSGQSRSSLEDLLECRNDALRKLGIRLVSMPENGGLRK